MAWTKVLVKSLGFKDEEGRAQFMTDPAARLHEPEASGGMLASKIPLSVHS